MKKWEKFSPNLPAGESWSHCWATPAPAARPGLGPLLPRWCLVSAEPRTAGPSSGGGVLNHRRLASGQ